MWDVSGYCNQRNISRTPLLPPSPTMIGLFVSDVAASLPLHLTRPCLILGSIRQTDLRQLLSVDRLSSASSMWGCEETSDIRSEVRRLEVTFDIVLSISPVSVPSLLSQLPPATTCRHCPPPLTEDNPAFTSPGGKIIRAFKSPPDQTSPDQTSQRKQCFDCRGLKDTHQLGHQYRNLKLKYQIKINYNFS